ncbi:MAG: glycosyltransferase [Chitinophagaceae bacterium]
MKKVLYVSYDGMTDPLGQSQVLPYLRGLTKEGYQFTILSFEKPTAFEKFGGLIQSICDTAGIKWVPLVFHTSPPVLSKIYDRYKLFSTAKRLHREKKFDLLHCRSYIAAELGLQFKKKLGIKFLFDMRGFWADEKKESGHWNQDKWLYKRIYQRYKALEKEFVQQADHSISLTEAGKKEFGRLYGGLLKDKGENWEAKCTVIPCCADLSHFNFANYTEIQKQELREKLGIRKEAVLLTYSGSLGDWYLLDEMLLFFKAFQQKYPTAIFLVLTREIDRLKNSMKKNKIDPATVITGFASYAELPLYLSLSTYSLFFIKPIYSKTASSPTKHAELMGMGIPVFCNDIGDTGYFLRQFPLGELVDVQAKDFLPAMERMEQKKTDKNEIRQVALEHFDVTVGVRRYKKVYKLLLT